MSNHLNVLAAIALGEALRSLSDGVIDLSATSGHVIVAGVVTEYAVAAGDYSYHYTLLQGSQQLRTFIAHVHSDRMVMAQDIIDEIVQPPEAAPEQQAAAE